MNIEDFAKTVLDRILEIGLRQSAPAAERMAQIANSGVRYYNVLLRTKLISKTNSIVQHGPFAGMQCTSAVGGSGILPRLIGSYEAELHDAIYQFADRGYQRVVNIGCGEGYYAVGLARLLPAAHVFALDSDPSAQAFCRSLAQLNGVADRITIMGHCTPDMLHDLAQPGTLIFCDCEGSEFELLDPIAVPQLLHCDILVELHDFIRPAISSALPDRFQSTHITRIIPQTTRDPRAYATLESFTDFERVFALCEFRGGSTPWGLFLAKER